MKLVNREGLFIGVCFIVTVVVIVLCVYLKLHQNTGPYRSCLDVRAKVSGKYNITGEDKLSSFEAYCELEKNEGGWMIIQYRFNGTLSFERNWTDYRNGFGDVEGEHWLGLEKVYQVTKEQSCELLVEWKDSLNTDHYLKYSSFGIAGELDQYRLITLGAYSGTVEDILRNHSGMKFSTPDRDNDAELPKTTPRRTYTYSRMLIRPLP
ncbi:fibrinogen-like protein A [Anopheles albimanus]|uniref:fibrinogen-like protein A n=1 Tax=Anopheles albimanus TaxID=7167 RepID=UPI0016401BD8|nr:fibrinogen-like protein A [Anopheles albimanus]